MITHWSDCKLHQHIPSLARSPKCLWPLHTRGIRRNEMKRNQSGKTQPSWLFAHKITYFWKSYKNIWHSKTLLSHLVRSLCRGGALCSFLMNLSLLMGLEKWFWQRVIQLLSDSWPERLGRSSTPPRYRTQEEKWVCGWKMVSSFFWHGKFECFE